MKNVPKFFFTIALIMTCGVITSVINYSPVPIFLSLVLSWALATGAVIWEKICLSKKTYRYSFTIPDEAAHISPDQAKVFLRDMPERQPYSDVKAAGSFQYSIEVSEETAEAIKGLLDTHKPSTPAWWKGTPEELEQHFKDLRR